MKINQPLSSSLPTQTRSSPCFKTNEKDQWMASLDVKKPITTQADEYYWQHQHQLQQSALTFNATTHEHDVASAPDTNQSKIDDDPTLSSLSNSPLPPALLPASLLKIKSPEHLNLYTPEVATCSAHPATLLANYLVTEKEHQALTDAIKTVVDKTMQRPTATIKPYQLFIDDNQVELALNTTHWSQQEILDLKSFIHQWVQKKGYSLKQLILNGEPQ